MPKRLLNVLLFTALAIAALAAACSPAATPAPTETPIPPTPTLPPATPTLAPTAVGAPTATSDSLFPKITADEWQKGPADARLTIIEYGDYQ